MKRNSRRKKRILVLITYSIASRSMYTHSVILLSEKEMMKK